MPAAGRPLGARHFNQKPGLLLALSVMLQAVCLGAAQTSGPPGAPTSNAPEGAAGNAQTQSADGSKLYVSLTDAELAKEVHELKHMEPAANQDMLPKILKEVGATTSAFFDDFSNTTCTEHIMAAVDTHFHPSEMYYNSVNRYLALAAKGTDKTHLEELRTDSKGDAVNLDAEKGVVTIGFVSMIEHFYPDYQKDSRFRLLGREEIHGTDTYVVAFAQRPEVARQTMRVKLADKSALAYVQGLAWIDPESFAVIRLRTDLLRPELSVQLMSETTEIEYTQVSFEQGSKTLWLPHTVKVNGRLGPFIFHNEHAYSDYRFFSVQAGQKTP